MEVTPEWKQAGSHGRVKGGVIKTELWTIILYGLDAGLDCANNYNYHNCYGQASFSKRMRIASQCIPDSFYIYIYNHVLCF